jgi:hypothetical protein
MNKEKIRKKILSVLEESKNGILNPKLLKMLKIGRNTGNESIYYKVIDELVNEGLVYREKKAVKGKTLLYLPKYKEDSLKKWNILKNQIKIDKKNIDCGFLLVRKEVFQNKEGLIKPIKGFVEATNHGAKGLMNKFSDIDKDYDYLYFWVENGNDHTIEDITANIYIPPLFYEPLDNGDCHKCNYNIDGYSIRIPCEKLLSWEHPLSKDIAYALIPLKQKHVDDEYDKIEKIPIVKLKYKDYKIEKLKGGEVTSLPSNRSPIDSTKYIEFK